MNALIRLADLLSKGEDLETALRLVGGNLANTDHLGNTTVVPGDAGADSFGRLRISEPVTLFDSKQLHDSLPVIWDDSEESGGGTSTTYNSNNASTTIGVSLNTNGKRTRQTFMRFNYQPGKSQLIFCTFVLDKTGGGTGVTRSIGYFDDNNGLFLNDNAGTYEFVRRTNVTGSPVDNTVNQSVWNIDTMDGNGPSKVTMDFTKSQILVIDFEWLGVGRVRMGFVVDGKIYYAHQFLMANSITEVYMSTPNLPIRYQIELSGGTGAASTLEHICSTVISEGGRQDNGVLRYASTDNTQVDCAVVGALYLVKGIRLKSTHLDATVKMISAAIQIQSASDDIEWRLVFDPTYGAGPAWINEINSAVQTCTGTGQTVIGGYAITGGYLATGAAASSSASIEREIENALLLGAAIDGTAQTIALCAKPLTNVNTLVEGSITWRELA